jgi:iron complex transport system permease protein
VLNKPLITAAEIKQNYKKGKKRKIYALLIFIAALLVSVIVSVSLGSSTLGFEDAVTTISAKLFPFLNLDPGSVLAQRIILDVRLSRITLAIIAGAGLAVSGATMQGVLRNPLVSSYILGISAAAGFGASLALVFGIGVLTSVSGYMVIINAFVFSLIAMLIVYGVARMKNMTKETVILVGVAVSYLFSALLSLVQYFGPESDAVRQVVYWMMGGLDRASWANNPIVFSIVLVASILMMQQSWNINVLSLGEDVAISLGVNAKRALGTTLILSALATSAIIAFTGVIGFVCLIAPHMARMLIGSDHRFLIPCSALVGACLLLCSDTIGRLILAPTEIPVGVITSMIGAPFFIYILLTKRRKSWL